MFLNAKGGRLSSRAAGGIIAEIAQTAGLDDPTTAHVLRHTLATTLVRGSAAPPSAARRACRASRPAVARISPASRERALRTG
ncbi:tyrosine-type recombinase/integrase [Nonomuraea sp. SMC257]|uniref:Tyrosine-type recombinase/integrase n=1 Tax=Nonomuraea montanisoli TaxID=2741721 RepID=A0A7Y6M5Y9_9ACTN|nr:tyrosine-type recombinase/integrase [Nonomuraea montanisoli]